MGYSLALIAKIIYFYWEELPGAPETAQISPKLLFLKDLHQFVGTFSTKYFQIAC